MSTAGAGWTGLGIHSLRGPGSRWPRLDRKMCVIAFEGQAVAPAGVRSSLELQGPASGLPRGGGELRPASAGVSVALLEGTDGRRVAVTQSVQGREGTGL